jgi:hypothetical protein
MRGNPTVDFNGPEARSNEHNESKTDPNALLTRKGKGKEAKLSYNGLDFTLQVAGITSMFLALTHLNSPDTDLSFRWSIYESAVSRFADDFSRLDRRKLGDRDFSAAQSSGDLPWSVCRGVWRWLPE